MTEETNSENTMSHIRNEMILGYGLCGIYVDFNFNRGHKLMPLDTSIEDISCIPCLKAKLKQLERKAEEERCPHCKSKMITITKCSDSK